ncbi:MAG: rRNA maturation RNase YbeY [Bacteroidales bacterium]|nr:rRNA maturation RNase YbeY [Bacteroidales bacterium]
MIRYAIEAARFALKERRKRTAWITAVIRQHGKVPGEIQYIFTDDEHILKINREFLQHDYCTDIITFDYTEGDTLSGDIFISIDTVRDNAQTYGETSRRELLRVMIHGVLHLAGFNDKTEAEQRVMRTQEDAALELWATEFEGKGSNPSQE